MNDVNTHVAEAVVLVQQGQAVPVYMDEQGQDYAGIRRVSSSLAGDIQLVTDVLPELITDKTRLSKSAVIAGTIGQNDIIDSLIAEGRLEVTSLRSLRESFIISVVENPCPELDQGIVIAGSEKRGTLYGLYHISRLIGVSPWVYWADVYPAKQPELVFTKEQLEFASKEPSIRYRGFFLNDEWPSLGSWSRDHCDGFSERMYEQVFELLLRLKGNFLWPAMWSAVFSEDGLSYPLANAALAEEYGIVMGTSHHEPMCRAGEEWKKTHHLYGEHGLWDYWSNQEAITKFWEAGVVRNKPFANVITLGMRGEQDSALGGTLEENIRRLKEIILTQKELLRRHGLERAPQALTIYKEVEAFWYGTDEVQGLQDWDVLDDVTIIMSDDNFGNMRKLPEEGRRNRQAGWGIYYHFDYHGAPNSYEWVNTVPLEKIWEQMSLAYDYGIKDLWIVNVGDLKPMELPLSYFMELAYDFEAWGTAQPNRTREFLQGWVKQQFDHAVVAPEALGGIAEVLEKYTRMNGQRKPEVTYADTYSVSHYDEGQRMLAEVLELERQAGVYYSMISEPHRDAYYQLVYYPAVASANVKKMQIYAGFNQKYSSFTPPSLRSNDYADLVEEAIARDKQLQQEFNHQLSGGKWSGMMSSAHIGYANWNDEGWQYPAYSYVVPQKNAWMMVDVEGTLGGFGSGTLALPTFTNVHKESYRVTISHAGEQVLDYCVKPNADWIKLERQQGSYLQGEDLYVSLDWEQVKAPLAGEIVITYGHQPDAQTVRITVHAQIISTDALPPMTFVETNGVVVMEAEHTCDRKGGQGAFFEVIEKYGRSLSAVKLFPTTLRYERYQEAPYLSYRLWVAEQGIYTVTVHTAPTNPLTKKGQLPYAIGMDDNEPVIAQLLPAEFVAGESRHWEQAVLNNVHTHATQHVLGSGLHTLRIYVLDAGLVLQRLIVSRVSLPFSYFGPPESYFKR
ncbi:glycosyl hydrolase 115 family protein [Paenibacillus sanguinis]|uniref:glycosyl hydrolase 115 family protein n=1 Tax=Paenibacillus sanguinis TaxID=225906 RepID=UPI00036C1690|nr:glycosyl hydrolase 115 family protein [Paenibacillus sanguinis]